MKKVIVLIALASFFTSTSYAGCGWVLWQVDAQSSNYTVSDGYPTHEKCQSGMQNIIKNMKKASQSDNKISVTSDTIITINNSSYYFKCLPSDIDPRIR